jgi:two-component system, cell cycle response regulator CtrA
MRALLIEDDKVIATSIELMLKLEDISVYTTNTGEEGLDLAKFYDYDIILLDIGLPDISGFDVLRFYVLLKLRLLFLFYRDWEQLRIR